MDYNEVWVSRSTFHKKAKKKFTRCSIYLAKNLHFLGFLARSSEMPNMFGRLHFKCFL